MEVENSKITNICLVKGLYYEIWENVKKRKDKTLKCESCPLYKKCKEEENK